MDGLLGGYSCQVYENLRGLHKVAVLPVPDLCSTVDVYDLRSHGLSLRFLSKG